MGFLLLSACSAETPEIQPYTNLSAQPFAQILQEEGAVLLDVRTPAENQNARIEGSTLVPVREFEAYLGQLPEAKETPILVYCNSGSRSRYAAQQLSQRGYTRVYNLAGGILQWYQEGFPLVGD
jgi:rhodanese-related sulfurtransferase